MTTIGGDGPKLAFSLKSKKKSTTSSKLPSTYSLEGFETNEEPSTYDDINNDLPKEPLIIPVQQDARQSLQEQARLRRAAAAAAQEQPEAVPITPVVITSAEDQAAIQALQAEASGETNNDESSTRTSKMVIQGKQNTFQSNNNNNNNNTTTTTTTADDVNNTVDMDDSQQFQQDLTALAPEVSVKSEVYQQVPISQFGAAMLRGMGWTGTVDTSDVNDQNMPRPSRLGLGATPKLLDAPTHNKRSMRRQDQVQRDQQRQQQQQEYEQQRQQQLKMDKQRTIQVGSIIKVVAIVEDQQAQPPRRAIVRQWQGVPGLNMVLVQYEGAKEPAKVKKGSVQLIDRKDLETDPFEEPPEYQPPKTTDFLGQKGREENDDRKKDRRRDEDYDDDEDRNRHRRDGDRRRRDDDDRKRSRDDDNNNNNNKRHDREDDKRRRRNDDDDRNKRRREDDTDDRHKRRRDRETSTEQRPSKTWLIPNIRVRIVTSKYGKSYYKEKGVVVDVTAKGSATLKVGNNGQTILQIPERYLETALPKVGGNACILTGKHQWAKGRLLERDSKANKGSIQVFEDMNIVTTSLDDMAEWCGPLDDDLME
jgi:hypothetical protein